MSRHAASDPDVSEAAALGRLRRAWRVWCAAGVLALGASAVILSTAFGEPWIRWALPSALSLAAVLAFIHKRLPLNREVQGGPLLPRPGVGNHLTVARGLLIAQLPGYLFLPQPPGAAAWLPAFTTMAALILDYLDGFYARRQGAVTRFGEALDIEFDGLATLSGAAVAVHYGRLPLLYLATVGSARYAFLLAGWIARRFGRMLQPLPPSEPRRALAGVSMELGAAALWPIAPAPLMAMGGAILGVPFLGGFVRDGLIHLGLLDPGAPTYLRARRLVVRFGTRVIPPVLRLALPVLLAPRLLSGSFGYGESAPLGLDVLGRTLSWLGLVLMTLGFAGRTGAVLVVIAYGISLALTGFSSLDVAGWGAAFAVYVLGTGPVSLWAPERSLYLGRAGERS